MRKTSKRWLIPLSAAMIALLSAGTAFAADMVNVKVENTRGGYVVAYYEDDDSNRQYLPIGETVQVPKGTEVAYTATAKSYHPNGRNTWYQGIVFDVEKWVGSDVSDPDDVYRKDRDEESGMIIADQNLTIKGIFKAYEKKRAEGDEDDEIWYTLGFKEEDYVSESFERLSTGAFSEQLYLYDEVNEKIYPFTSGVSVDIDSIYYTDANGDDQDVPDDLFTVDRNGKLTASKPLDKGYYWIDGSFTYQGKTEECWFNIEIGPHISVSIPMAFYKNSDDSYYSIKSVYLTDYFAENLDATFNDEAAKLKTFKTKLAGHELTGLAEKNNTTFKNLGTSKIRSKISEKDPSVRTYAMYNNYTVPTIEHLTKDDVIPETVAAGWNQIGTSWYYYETTDPSSLAKNQWVPCRDNDGEDVWVGSDGRMVVNGVVYGDVGRYLVGANGHKLRSQNGYTIGNVDYTTDENGIITGTKLHLATPSDATKADQFVDDVMDNMGSLTEEEQKKAADMVTESLKKNVDTSKMTPAETKKYADLYREVYGESNIDIAGDASNADSIIVAAGLTSKDFEENGNVTIELENKWVATSSNAVKVELKLNVNGKARELAAPVEAEFDLPEAFIASYSNASYNFDVTPKPVSYKIENGRLVITFNKAGVYTVQATRKRSSSGSRGGSSSGGGRATVNAGYKASNGKTGNWVHDKKGWWFKYQDGTWPKSEWVELEWNGVKSWYYFGADGYMMTGWYQSGGNWYYLHPKADGTCGYMYTGWHEIAGNWYYFRTNAGGPRGSLIVNGTTPDGYKVNANGEWVK